MCHVEHSSMIRIKTNHTYHDAVCCRYRCPVSASGRDAVLGEESGHTDAGEANVTVRF